METCVFYVDEAGSPHAHHNPLKNGETPILTLGALAFSLDEWRRRDRTFLALKRKFFPDLLENSKTRDEYYEIKGRDITTPRNASSERRHAFLKEILKFIQLNDGCCFGVTSLKNPSTPMSSTSIYTRSLQILVERFSTYIAESGKYKNGIIIIDSRKGMGKDHDINVAMSHMSYIFGHKTGRTFTNIVEAPLFADSRITVGLQIADIFTSVLYTNHYARHIKDCENIVNYEHMTTYWEMIRSLQFKSKNLVDGRYLSGYRVVDLNRSE